MNTQEYINAIGVMVRGKSNFGRVPDILDVSPDRSLQDHLTASKHALPEEVIDKIDQISRSNSLGEKVSIAHLYSLEKVIQIPQRDEEEKGSPNFESMAQIAEAGNIYGDCDDHAYFSAGLLLAAGVPQNQIILATATVTYRAEVGQNVREMTGHHSFVIAGNEQGELFIIDNNLSSAVPFDTTSMTTKGYGTEHPDRSVEMHIDNFLVLANLDQTTLIDRQFFESITSSRAVAPIPFETERMAQSDNSNSEWKPEKPTFEGIRP